MIESGINGKKCHSVFCHAKANGKYMESYDQINDSPYFIHLDKNNLYDLAISLNLPVNGFEWEGSYDEIEKLYIFLKLT